MLRRPCYPTHTPSHWHPALLFVASLLGCGGVVGSGPPPLPPGEPNVVSLDPQSWNIYYSSGLPPHPNADTEGAWSFGFPNSSSGGHVNYVQTPFNVTVSPHNISVTFRVDSGAPIYQVLDPTDIPPATFHIFFEQQGDDLTNPNGRWWADGSGYNLGSNDGKTLTWKVPFTYDQWSNVFGRRDPTAFSDALQNIGWVGLTFGGQYFWGHGVAMNSGNAKFVLVNARID
jgi:hypothetical protein